MINKFLNISEQFTVAELAKFIVKKALRKKKQQLLKKSVDSGKVFNINFIDHNIEARSSFLQESNELNLAKNLQRIKDRGLYSSEKSKIIKEAELYCNNQFDIFGSGWNSWEIDGKIEWQRDIKSGYRWDVNQYYLEISKGLKRDITKNKGLQIDIKIPRELSRFYFILTLYSAYKLSGNKIYLNKIKDSILCWIEENPPFFGVNWTNAMEASIRIINWSLVLYALKNELGQDTLFMEIFYSSLYQHQLYIMTNLENIFHRNNHYLSNVIGMYVASTFFPIFKESEKWHKWSSKEIKKEFAYQVYEDGGNFESSTSYNRLAIELLFLPQYLAQQFGHQLFDEVETKKFEKMFFQIMNTTKPNGENIQFGDNDDGRVIKLFARKSLCHSYLVPMGFGLFNNDGLVQKNIPFDILAYLFFGDYMQQKYQKIKTSAIALKSEKYVDTGIYILRNAKFFVAVSCMPNGQYGKGVHTHNDKLSFEMNYEGKNIIVDPGTYCYTSDPKARNKFRSTEYHNTIMENDLEQNDFGETIFQLRDQAKVRIDKFSNNELLCEHNGYVKKGGSKHRRKFNLSVDKLIINDYLVKERPAKVYFHFAAGILPEKEEDIITIKDKGKTLFYLQIKNSSNIYIEDYDYSPSYGEIVSCKKVIVEVRGELNSIFISKK